MNFTFSEMKKIVSVKRNETNFEKSSFTSAYKSYLEQEPKRFRSSCYARPISCRY